MPSVKNPREGTQRINRIVNDNETKDEQCSSSSKRPNMGSGWMGKRISELRFLIFLEREGVTSL